MAKFRAMNISGMNLKVSPFLQKEGELLQCLNLDPIPYGAKRKRSGYTTFLGTANGSASQSLFSWTKEDGTTLNVYGAFGNKVYYSLQGTAAWALAGNGTITAGVAVGHAVLDDTLFMNQQGGTMRHTTNGSAFTDTTAAPPGGYLCSSRDNRVYIGSASTLFYSTSGDGTNWSTSGTSDSSSLTIPGEGAINGVFYANDRVVITKDSGLMYRYDGYNLVRVPTNEGLSSYESLAQVEDYWIYLNRQGYLGYNGDRPELLSNPIENQIYNNAGSAIVGTTFDSAPGVAHRMNYLCAVGTVTDEITEETIANCIQRYNFQFDDWDNYAFGHVPTSWCSYKDADGDKQLIFGASGGQCYQMNGTATADNTSAIMAGLQGFLHFGAPEQDKKFNRLWAIASPGCQAKVQVAIGDSFRKDKKNWIDVGDLRTGIRKLDFPGGTRGKLLFYQLTELSKDAPFTFYGFVTDYENIGL